MAGREHRVVVEGPLIRTPRLVLRPWDIADAEAALAIYGDRDVSRWLAPAIGDVTDLESMSALLDQWITECVSVEQPQGRWAVQLRDTNELIGGAALLPLPPRRADLEIAWQLSPAAWGHGYAAEAGHAVAHQAFQAGLDIEELFAVVRPGNTRGIATAKRVGMEWVGETEKYYDLKLQIYRLRKADLDDDGPLATLGEHGSSI
jgi:RimJ/RimL family protein N-acetyltransferase